MNLIALSLANGLMAGGIYALVAIGWVMAYKCSGVLNLAMGEVTLFGALVALALYDAGFGFFPALFGSALIAAFFGFFLERIFFSRLAGRGPLPSVMATVGLSFILKGLLGIFWGSRTRVFSPGVFSDQPLLLGFLRLSPAYLWSFFLAIAICALFSVFFKKTRQGLNMQAAADDEAAAWASGISLGRVRAVAFALAFACAALGGGLLAAINGVNASVSHLGLLVLPAVVFGGLNSLAGAVVGGLCLGVAENLAGAFLDPYLRGAKDLAPFVFMAFFMWLKPYGLWGWERIERL